jgi:nucleotide sugar dehydrogenase
MNTLGVFGLGYVGGEISALALRRGIDVYGVDSDEAVVEALRQAPPHAEGPGVFHVSTTGAEAVSAADAVVVAVPTPLSSSHAVDLGPVRSVCRTVAETLEPRADLLPVSVESTVPPGTVSEVVAPIFEDHGWTVGEDIHLAHAPERIDPNNDEWPLKSIPRVVGGLTPAGTEVVAEVYERLLDAEIHRVGSPAVAAAAKIVENAYRDINIAFVNEVALTLDRLDIDAKEALDAAATKPFGYTRFSPGAGVGGHCIPIDPYFLIEKASANGFDNRFLKTAREINDRMPEYTAEKTIRATVRSDILPQEATALLLGKAFKPGVKDVRNSPYHAIRTRLEEYDMAVETYDPRLPEESTVDSPAVGADVLVLVTAHEELCGLDFDRLAAAGTTVFVDGRNVYDPTTVEGAGVEYVGIGRN